MVDELKIIREELLAGVEQGDLLHIKFQINRIDTLIFNLVSNEATVKRENVCFNHSCRSMHNYKCVLGAGLCDDRKHD